MDLKELFVGKDVDIAFPNSLEVAAVYSDEGRKGKGSKESGVVILSATILDLVCDEHGCPIQGVIRYKVGKVYQSHDLVPLKGCIISLQSRIDGEGTNEAEEGSDAEEGDDETVTINEEDEDEEEEKPRAKRASGKRKGKRA